MKYKLILFVGLTLVHFSKEENTPDVCPKDIFWIDAERDYVRMWHDDLEHIRFVKKEYVYKYADNIIEVV